MQGVSVVLLLGSIAFAQDVELKVADASIDSVLHNQNSLRDSINVYYKDNKSNIDIHYREMVELVILKQYKSHFKKPGELPNKTKEVMMLHSKGTWFPNILRLENEMSECVVNSLLVASNTELMKKIPMLSTYSFIKCADKISSDYHYEYE